MLLTKRQVAARWQVSTRTIDRWRARGYDVGAVKTPGGSVRFDAARLEAIIAARQFRRRR